MVGVGRHIPTVAAIQQAVASHFGVPVSWMREPDGTPGTQKRIVSHPRQVAMVLAWQMTDHSGPRIGHFFGDRDHTTILHARRSVQKRREADPKLDRAMKRIALELVR
jgi:chromosomal replication initiator protein